MRRQTQLRIGIGAVALMLALFAAGPGASLVNRPVPSVIAAPLGSPESWTSGFQVQNLGSATATVKVAYYNQDGTIAGQQTVTIEPGKSYTFFGATMAVGDGFYGSVVIEADQPIAAIANELSAGPNTAASYNGIIAPATTFYLPLIMREVGAAPSYNTEIFIQNAGTADASNVRLEFYRGATAVASKTLPAIRPGAAFTLRQIDQTELGIGFVGSAKVTSDQPVAAVVNQSNGQILFGYAGFSSGASNVYAPLLMKNNRGWDTGFQVQNIGTSAVTVNLRVGGQVVDTVTVAPFASKTWFPIPGVADGFVGAGIAEGPTGSQLVGIVNELHGPSGQGMSYNAFSTGTSKVYAPLLMTDRGGEGWQTGWQVQNVGATAVTVNLKVDGRVVDTATIGAGASKTWYPIPGTSAGFVGSGLVEGPPGSQLVGIVNQIQTRPAGGETSMAYEAFNQ